MEARKKESPEFDLEAATSDAIAACGGDLRATIRALIVANNFLTKELEFAWPQISPGYSRGKRTRRSLAVVSGEQGDNQIVEEQNMKERRKPSNHNVEWKCGAK